MTKAREWAAAWAAEWGKGVDNPLESPTMGWTCQHDSKGFCKLLKVPCQPGIKGCIIHKGAEVVFTTGSYEEDRKKAQEGESGEIDFAALARSN